MLRGAITKATADAVWPVLYSLDPRCHPMQIIVYERGDHNFFCPVTAQPVYNDLGEPMAPSFRAFWIDQVPEEPLIHDPDLQAAWDAYRDQWSDTEECIQPEDFLRSYERKGWVVFQITTGGFACGPVWETVWTILDLEYVPGEGEVWEEREPWQG
jgi:hypothetical protein